MQNNKHNFHISDISNFQQCRYKWYFSSHLPGKLGRGIEADAGPMWKGSEVHLGLEHYYGKKPIPESIAPENRAIIDFYIQWAKKNDDFKGIINTEKAYEVPFFTDDNGVDHTFNSRFDLIVYDKDRKIHIVDFKCTSQSFDGYEGFIRNQNEQARCYSFMGRELYGSNFGGITFVFIKSKAPEAPRVLANGQLSRAKNQNTTWSQYLEYIEALQHDPNDYADVRESLTNNEYIRRVTIKFTDKALDRFHKRNILVAKEMISPNLTLYPTPNPIQCKSCIFQYPCNIKLDISDKLADQFVLANFETTNYTQRAKDELNENS